MNKISLLLSFIFLSSCTSNTIFKKPQDLIPRDTMSLLIQDMMIASSAKFIKNVNKQKKINYMSFVYDKYKIDSVRFQNSNFYYISKIDLYEEIITDAKVKLEDKKKFFTKIKATQDSINKLKRKKIRDTLFSFKDTVNFKKGLNLKNKIPKIKK
ncbi:DUF4296 domain-containing protein [uncultured Polaribacter sp.]|uniref:DUF4296 domain-containing protein n=1 Tax=uncultured Polaribacter sp. TaxID=174711 RepID=UPI0026033BA5|nr:DUF4296 domain-containing protein [uncultured Polaribacter sp.]